MVQFVEIKFSIVKNMNKPNVNHAKMAIFQNKKHVLLKYLIVKINMNKLAINVLMILLCVEFILIQKITFVTEKSKSVTDKSKGFVQNAKMGLI